MSQHELQAERLVAGYDHRTVIHGIDLNVPSGKISVIIGPNGCGKSTLLKSFSRIIQPQSGALILDGKNIKDYRPRQLAQQLGLLPQSPLVPEGITVFDLVSRGRFPYRSFMKDLSKRDFEVVTESLAIMGISELANRNVDELSGGQRQRVWIALSLAQETDILLLDEPTTFLDISYQVEILDLLRELNRSRGTTIVMVLHDINFSSRYADQLFAMRNGQVITKGRPAEVISSDFMREVFDLDCEIIRDPISNSPFIIPISRSRKAGETTVKM